MSMYLPNDEVEPTGDEAAEFIEVPSVDPDGDEVSEAEADRADGTEEAGLGGHAASEPGADSSD